MVRISSRQQCTKFHCKNGVVYRIFFLINNATSRQWLAVQYNKSTAAESIIAARCNDCNNQTGSCCGTNFTRHKAYFTLTISGCNEALPNLSWYTNLTGCVQIWLLFHTQTELLQWTPRIEQRAAAVSVLFYAFPLDPTIVLLCYFLDVRNEMFLQAVILSSFWFFPSLHLSSFSIYQKCSLGRFTPGSNESPADG